jgi:NAD(P)-dependent dehydrogenase (short-subunit alcohol dehydrogenase family)
MRTAVVTGAAHGIGAETAGVLAGAGFEVWLLDRDGPDAKRVAEHIGGRVGAHAIEVDVSSVDSVRAAFAQLREASPTVDALVNCAGVSVASRFEEIDPADFEHTFRVNVLGPYLCLQAALPALRRCNGSGRVVNVASVAAKQPTPYLAAYGASKAALISLTRSAAAALAPDVLVNAVVPGAIDTTMWATLGEQLRAIDADRATSAKERGASVPLGRPGTAREVAELIAALCGPAGAYITGEDINCTGGSVMH